MDLRRTNPSTDKSPGHLIVLLGNLSVGKTSIFERLCRGKHGAVNYTGVPAVFRVSRITGTDYTLMDTPGVHSVFTLSEDESIARDTILNARPESLLFVADAKNLSRALSLFFQFTEYDLPAVLDLNMMDEARQHGVSIDVARLSGILGIPVNASVAVEGIGLRTLKRVLPEARKPVQGVKLPDKIEDFLSEFRSLVSDRSIPSRAVGLQALTEDHAALEFLSNTLEPEVYRQVLSLVKTTRAQFYHPPEVLLHETYTRAAQRVTEEVQTVSPPKHIPFSEKLGYWSRNLTTGIPIALLVLALMYLVVGEFGAQYLVGLVEGRLFGELIIPMVATVCEKVPFPLLERFMVGEFGLVSVALSLALGVVAPVLFMFFLVFGIIEDSGYLARLSVLFGRLLKKMGLSGKGVLPIVMGFSCVTMAILTTRVLETRKERIIATLLLLLGMPCAPLLSVMLVILTHLNWKAYVVVFGVIFLQMLLAGLVAERLIPGERSTFFMEIPPLRIPRMRSILVKTTQRIMHFTAEAIPVFILATGVLFVLNEAGFLRFLEYLGKPFLETFLDLPPESIRVVLSTMIRREAGAALLKELFDRGLFSDVQTVLLMLICTFLVPCVNALVVTYKEHGFKTATFMLLFVTPYALVVGIVLNYLFRVFQIRFG
jgi:ferrous iron transport protein B